MTGSNRHKGQTHIDAGLAEFQRRAGARASNLEVWIPSTGSGEGGADEGQNPQQGGAHGAPAFVAAARASSREEPAHTRFPLALSTIT